ncbi:MAG: fumarylacetoacetate hydrolase family protein [Flavobacteriaceae bacterium]|nr:fumarylacetoacetate hydrolase family protein [Flavobacteriaceae bacterium]
MLQDTEILTAASQLEVAAASKVPCDPVRAFIGETSQDKAYAVQKLITKSRILQGAEPIGKKIGLTSVKVQEQLGVDQPDFGVLFNDMELKNGGELSISETMQPKAEAEIAFVLKKGLLSKNPSLKEIEDAIDYAVAAIEVVGSRIANWDIKITDTIADNASASHFVLGDVKRKLSEIDVIGCEMQLFQNDQLVSQGSGAACLGSPLIAVQWLAKKMVEMESPLKAGDIILSGALGPMVNVVVGDSLLATVEGLGGVSINFTE